MQYEYFVIFYTAIKKYIKIFQSFQFLHRQRNTIISVTIKAQDVFENENRFL